MKTTHVECSKNETQIVGRMILAPITRSVITGNSFTETERKTLESKHNTRPVRMWNHLKWIKEKPKEKERESKQRLYIERAKIGHDTVGFTKK